MREAKALSPQPCAAAKPDSKDNPMRPKDGAKRAAGQGPEHWASHVSPGSKPQHCSLPPAASQPGRMGAFELPARRHGAPLPRLSACVRLGPRTSCCPGAGWLNRAHCSAWGWGSGPGEPSRVSSLILFTLKTVPVASLGQHSWTPPWGSKQQAFLQQQPGDTHKNAHPLCQ